MVSYGDNGSVLNMEGSEINMTDVLLSDMPNSGELIAISSVSEDEKIIIKPYKQTEPESLGIKLDICSLTEQEKPVSIILDSESKYSTLNFCGINGKIPITGDTKLPEMRLRCNSRITLESRVKKHSLEMDSILIGCELTIEDGVLIKGANSDVNCYLEDEDSVLNIGALAAGSGKINVIIQAVGARVCVNPASANNVSVSGEGVVLNSSKDINGNIIYTATVSSSYDIILNPCQGTVETSTLSYKHGAEIGKLPVPSRSGYTFDGWYTEETGGDLIEDDLEVIESLSLYAHWTKDNPKDNSKDNPATGDDTWSGVAMVMMMLSIGGIAMAKKGLKKTRY